MTELEEQTLRTLGNAPNSRDGQPLDWRIGMTLVKRGWAELGLRYGHYRITEAGRRALAGQEIGQRVRA